MACQYLMIERFCEDISWLILRANGVNGDVTLGNIAPKSGEALLLSVWCVVATCAPMQSQAHHCCL